MIETKIVGDSVIVPEKEDAEEVHSEHYYGKFVDDQFRLAPVEAYHLVDREIIKVEGFEAKEELYAEFAEKDEEFDVKYAVYTDMRERGYIVKTGFKFGAHFRVYPRGVNPYKSGDKKEREHTKYVLQAVPENQHQQYTDLSRAVRLAQNIRAEMVWGVVDSERNVTYYKVSRMTP